MSTFVLVPGAGGNASYWRELVAELERRGHEAVAVDIPQDDPAVGLPEYAALVEAAIGDRTDTVLVAQSLGGFTAPMVGSPVRMIVLLNAMIPLPGETPGRWWGATGSDAARRAAEEAAGRDPEFDEERTFFHDLPDDVRAQMERRPTAARSGRHDLGPAVRLRAWPDVPIQVVVGRDDRLFPWEFQQRVSRERLGVEPDLLPGGHVLAKSRPAELADLLEDYAGLWLRPQGGSSRLSVAASTVEEMLETPAELAGLQSLLDASHARATDHLRGIIHGDRTLSAEQVVALLPGMKVISVATVTAHGEPRISAMDGHFLHGTWTFSTSRTAAKARHLAARPGVSVAHVDGEQLAVFSHGHVVELGGDELAEVDRHWTAHYGSSPLSWGDVVMYRLDPSWMVGYAWKRDELLAERGVAV